MQELSLFSQIYLTASHSFHSEQISASGLLFLEQLYSSPEGLAFGA